jgi:hypothetical protein
LLWGFFRSSPYWLALFTSIVVCFIMLGRYTAPSLFALGFVLLVFSYFASVIVSRVINSQIQSLTPTMYDFCHSALQLLSSTMDGIAIVPLVVAVFIRRRAPYTFPGSTLGGANAPLP